MPALQTGRSSTDWDGGGFPSQEEPNGESGRHGKPASCSPDHPGRRGGRNLQAIAWSIENYHRALKELCCVEDCRVRKEAGQRSHINCSLRAFIRLEAAQHQQNITIYQVKWEIVRSAITEYVRHPKSAL